MCDCANGKRSLNIRNSKEKEEKNEVEKWKKSGVI